MFFIKVDLIIDLIFPVALLMYEYTSNIPPWYNLDEFIIVRILFITEIPGNIAYIFSTVFMKH